MPKAKKKKTEYASLDKYGGSLGTVMAVGATVWAFFRVGFKIRDGVSKIKNVKRPARRDPARGGGKT